MAKLNRADKSSMALNNGVKIVLWSCRYLLKIFENNFNSVSGFIFQNSNLEGKKF